MTSSTGNRTTELLPCPFCGGEAETVGDDCMEWIAECIECCASSMAFPTEAEAIAAWNARYHCGLTDEDYNILLDELGVSERTCRIDSTLLIEGEYVPSPYYEYEMECGGGFCWDDSEPPTYCPNCGARVIGTEAVE